MAEKLKRHVIFLAILMGVLVGGRWLFWDRPLEPGLAITLAVIAVASTALRWWQLQREERARASKESD